MCLWFAVCVACHIHDPRDIVRSHDFAARLRFALWFGLEGPGCVALASVVGTRFGGLLSVAHLFCDCAEVLAAMADSGSAVGDSAALGSHGDTDHCLSVVPWLRRFFPEHEPVSPAMTADAALQLRGAVAARRLLWEAEMRSLSSAASSLDRLHLQAVGQALPGLSPDLRLADFGSQPVRHAVTIPAVLEPPTGAGGARGEGLASFPSVTAKARSRSRGDTLRSHSSPPVGFVLENVDTWPSYAPSDWCRACWAEVRRKKCCRPGHDAPNTGRCCALAEATGGGGLPDLLFGMSWRSAVLFGKARPLLDVPIRAPVRDAGLAGSAAAAVSGTGAQAQAAAVDVVEPSAVVSAPAESGDHRPVSAVGPGEDAAALAAAVAAAVESSDLPDMSDGVF